MDSLSTPLLLQVYYESLTQETKWLEKQLLDLCWVLLTYETVLTAVSTVLKPYYPQNQYTANESYDGIQALLIKIRAENKNLSCRLNSFKEIETLMPKSSFGPGEFKQAVETYKVVCDKIRVIEKLKATSKDKRKTRVKPVREKRVKKKGRKPLQEISNSANVGALNKGRA